MSKPETPEKGLTNSFRINFGYVVRFINNEIYFSKNNWKSYVFRYTAALFLSSIALILSLFLAREGHEAGASYLLLVMSVSLSAWVGGFGAGLLATSLAVVSIFLLSYFFYQLSMYSLVQIGLLFVIGIVISFIIESSKRVDLVSQFNLTEKRYKKEIELLQEQYIKAKKEIKVRDEFISIASHELKTPLASTLLKLQIALHNIRNVSLANFSVQNLLQMLESAEQQTKRLSKMINDLLNISLIRTGRLELELDEADLVKITKDVINSFKERAEKENIQIKYEANNPIIGRFDKLRIEQSIANLISNAVKYGEQKPIEINTLKENSTGKIIIKDYGIGIPSQRKDKIFELFERAIPNNSYQGLGVGLYITKQIIKAHKGKIHVKSKEGEGSVFTIELPLK